MGRMIGLKTWDRSGPGMGRMIGPKTWDRSVRIFGSRLGNLGTVTNCYGFSCDNLLNKLCFGVYKTGNG